MEFDCARQTGGGKVRKGGVPHHDGQGALETRDPRRQSRLGKICGGTCSLLLMRPVSTPLSAVQVLHLSTQAL